MRRKTLSRAQRRVLEFLKKFIKKNGWAPSHMEINARFKWVSPNAAQWHLQTLEKGGWIKRAPGRARAVQVLA